MIGPELKLNPEGETGEEIEKSQETAEEPSEENLPTPERQEQEVGPENKPDQIRKDEDLISPPEPTKPVETTTEILSSEKQAIIRDESRKALNTLTSAYEAGRGINTAADPESQFRGEFWARDSAFAMAAAARQNPVAAIETLRTLFSKQKTDGTLPLRVEYKRHWANYVPLFRGLKKVGIDFISRKEAYPVFENVHGALPARDTAPALIIACGEVFRASDEGKNFVKQNWEKMTIAIKREESFADPKDGLINGGSLQDWADSIMRTGKLSYVNILHFRAIREMAFMAKSVGTEEEAKSYRERAEQLKENVMKAFWDEEDGYIKAGADDARLDTVSNIFACLYLVNPEQAVRIQESLERRVKTPSGLLKNFDPPYPKSMVAFRYKLGGVPGYHNHCVWPWVSTFNILAKLRISRDYPNQEVKNKYLNEAANDLATVSQIHEQNQGFYENLNPENGQPLLSKFLGMTLYKSSPGFLGTAASFAAAQRQLSELGAIK